MRIINIRWDSSEGDMSEFPSLPAESVITSVVGASIGVLLPQAEPFIIHKWFELWRPVSLVTLIVAFGISAHFSAAGMFSNAHPYPTKAFRVALLFGLVCLLYFSVKVDVASNDALQILPDAHMALLFSVIFVWAIANHSMAWIWKWWTR